MKTLMERYLNRKYRKRQYTIAGRRARKAGGRFIHSLRMIAGRRRKAGGRVV